MSSAPSTRAARAMQADATAHRLGEIAVGRAQLADAAHQEAVGPHPGAEGAVGEDRELGGGVGAVEVGRRIGFGEAERLRLGDRVVERQLGLFEPRHHEVAGAVDDAGQAVDLVGAVAEVPDDRQRRGRGRLAVERRGGALGEHAELGQLRGEQRLVGGDHRLAGGERGGEDRLHRRAAGHLDDDVDVGIADELERLVGERDAGGERAAVLGEVAHGDAR